MVESARMHAIDVLLDKRLFSLGTEHYDAFLKALDALLLPTRSWSKAAQEQVAVGTVRPSRRLGGRLLLMRISTPVTTLHALTVASLRSRLASRSRSEERGEGIALLRRLPGAGGRCFYALAAGAVRHDQTKALKRRACRNKISVIVLGRMAVKFEFHGPKARRRSSRDALKRALSVAADIGARAVLVHAIDRKCAILYPVRVQAVPEGELTLFLSVTELAAAIDHVPGAQALPAADVEPPPAGQRRWFIAAIPGLAGRIGRGCPPPKRSVAKLITHSIHPPWSHSGFFVPQGPVAVGHETPAL